MAEPNKELKHHKIAAAIFAAVAIATGQLTLKYQSSSFGSEIKL
jgi:hypothetical protein